MDEVHNESFTRFQRKGNLAFIIIARINDYDYYNDMIATESGKERYGT